MLKRDYYHLNKAAETLGIDKEEIIYRGGTGEIPVYMLTRKYFVILEHINSVGAVVGTGTSDNKLAKLAPYCLQEFEAGKKDAAAIIQPKPFYEYDDKGGHQQNGEFRFQLRHKNMLYPSTGELRDAQRKGINIDLIYPEPVLIKDCKLVIMVDDLERLRETELQAEALGADGANSQDNTKPASTKVIQARNDSTDKTREREFHRFVWRARLFLIERGNRHTWLDVWREIESNHKQHDQDDIIQEAKNGLIFYRSSGGNEQKYKKGNLPSLITRLKIKPPF